MCVLVLVLVCMSMCQFIQISGLEAKQDAGDVLDEDQVRCHHR